MSLFHTPRKPFSSLYGTPKINENSSKTSQKKHRKCNEIDIESAITSPGPNEENVKVVIRIKPVEQESDRIWKVFPESNIISQKISRRKSVMCYDKLGNHTNPTSDSAFSFDKIFNESSATRKIYDHTAKDIVQSVVQDAKNGTIFCYGQTGSGKTFTMQGGDNSYSVMDETPSRYNEGIIYMAAQDILRNTQTQNKNENEQGTDDYSRIYSIRVSYMEIYNEEVRDLLQSSSINHHNNNRHRAALSIREDPSRGVFVDGLTEVEVTDINSILDLIRLGEQNRSVAATFMNERSSRSHTIFRITVQCRTSQNMRKIENSFDKENVDANKRNLFHSGSNRSVFKNRRSLNGKKEQEQRVSLSTLNLVDLAGSERNSHTGTHGARQKEGSKINQSLLTLSRVITGLIQNKTTHINFRDSKLTRILQPSLQGNARMAVICCISPSESYREETRSTLQFASRAKLIKTKAEINEVLMVNQSSGSQYQNKQLILLKQEHHQSKKRFYIEKKRIEQEMKSAHEKYESLRNFVLQPVSKNIAPSNSKISDMRGKRRKSENINWRHNKLMKKKSRNSDASFFIKREESSEINRRDNPPTDLHVSPEDLLKKNSTKSNVAVEKRNFVTNECSLLRQALQMKSREAQALRIQLDSRTKESSLDPSFLRETREENNSETDESSLLSLNLFEDLTDKIDKESIEEDALHRLREENERITSRLSGAKIELEQKEAQIKKIEYANKRTIEDLLGQKAEALDWVEELLLENENLLEQIESVKDLSIQKKESISLDIKDESLHVDQRTSPNTSNISSDIFPGDYGETNKSYNPIKDLFESVERELFTPQKIIKGNPETPLCSVMKDIRKNVHNLSEEHDRAIHEFRIQTKLDDLNELLMSIGHQLSIDFQEGEDIGTSMIFSKSTLDKSEQSPIIDQGNLDFEAKVSRALTMSKKISSRFSLGSDLIEDRETKEMQIQHLSEENKFLNENLENSFAQLKDLEITLKRQITSLEDKSKNLLENIESLNESNSNISAKYENLVEENAASNARSIEFENELHDLISNCKSIIEHNKATVSGMEAKSIHDNNEDKTNDKIVESSYDIMNSMRKILNERKNEIIQLKNGKEAAFTQMRELLIAAEGRQKILNNLTCRNTEIEKRNAECINQLSELADQNKNLIQDRNSFERLYSETLTKLESKNEGIAKTSFKIEAMTKEVNILKREKENARIKLSYLSSSFAEKFENLSCACESRIRTLEQKLKACTHTFIGCQEKIQLNNTKSEIMRENSLHDRATIDELVTEMSELESLKLNLEEKLDESVQKLETNTAVKQSDEAIIHSLHSKIKEVTNQREKMIAEAEDLKIKATVELESSKLDLEEKLEEALQKLEKTISMKETDEMTVQNLQNEIEVITEDRDKLQSASSIDKDTIYDLENEKEVLKHKAAELKAMKLDLEIQADKNLEKIEALSSMKQSDEATIQSLQSEIEVITEDRDKLQSVSSMDKDTIYDLEAKTDELKNRAVGLEAMKCEALQKVDDLSAMKQLDEATIQSLHNEIEVITEDRNNLQSASSIDKETIYDLENEKEELKRKATMLEALKLDLEIQADKNLEKIEALSSMKQSDEATIQSLQSEIEVITEDRDKLQSVSSMDKDTIYDLEAKTDELKNRAVGLEAMKCEALQKVDDLSAMKQLDEATIQSLHNEIEVITEDRDKLQSASSIDKDTIYDLENEKEELKRKATMLEALKLDLEIQADKNLEKIEALSSMKQSDEATIQSLQSEIEVITEDRDKLQSVSSMDKDTIYDLEAKTDELKNRAVGLEAMKCEALQKVDDLSAMKQLDEATIQSLHNEIEVITEDRDKLQSASSIDKDTIYDLENEKEELKRKATMLEALKLDLEIQADKNLEKIEALSSMKQSDEATIQSLQSEIEVITEDRDKLQSASSIDKDAINNLENQKEELKNRASELESTKINLKEDLVEALRKLSNISSATEMKERTFETLQSEIDIYVEERKNLKTIILEDKNKIDELETETRELKCKDSELESMKLDLEEKLEETLRKLQDVSTKKKLDEATIQSLHSKIEEMMEERNKFNEIILGNKNELVKLESKAAELESIKINLEEKLETTLKKHDSAHYPDEAIYQNLQNKLREVEEEFQTFKKLSCDEKDTIKELESIKLNLEEKLDVTLNKLDDVTNKKSRDEAALETLQKEIDEVLQPKIDLLTNNYDISVETISKLESSLEKNHVRHVNKLKSLKQEKDEAFASTKKLQEDLRSIENDSDKYRCMEELESNLEALRQEKVKVEEKRDSTLEELERLKDHSHDIEVGLKTAINKLNGTICEQSVQIDQLKRQKQHLEKSVESYLEKYNCEKEKMDSTLSFILTSNEDLKRIIEEKGNENAATIKEQDNLRKDLKRLHDKRIKILTEENDQLRIKISHLETDIESWKNTFDKMNVEVDEFETCMKILHDTNKDLENRCDDLTEELNTYKADGNESEDKIAVLSMKLEVANEDIDELRSQLEDQENSECMQEIQRTDSLNDQENADDSIVLSLGSKKGRASIDEFDAFYKLDESNSSSHFLNDHPLLSETAEANSLTTASNTVPSDSAKSRNKNRKKIFRFNLKKKSYKLFRRKE